MHFRGIAICCWELPASRLHTFLGVVHGQGLANACLKSLCLNSGTTLKGHRGSRIPRRINRDSVASVFLLPSPSYGVDLSKAFPYTASARDSPQSPFPGNPICDT